MTQDNRHRIIFQTSLLNQYAVAVLKKENIKGELCTEQLYSKLIFIRGQITSSVLHDFSFPYGNGDITPQECPYDRSPSMMHVSFRVFIHHRINQQRSGSARTRTDTKLLSCFSRDRPTSGWKDYSQDVTIENKLSQCVCFVSSERDHRHGRKLGRREMCGNVLALSRISKSQAVKIIQIFCKVSFLDILVAVCITKVQQDFK